MAISAKVEKIISEVKALNEKEHDELMSLLDPTADMGISAEWNEEVRRRTTEIDEGKVQLIEESDFLRKLRAM